MRKEKCKRVAQFVFTLLIGLCMWGFTSGLSTVCAETQTAIAEEAVPMAEEVATSGSGILLILGGMLLIILTVVISVVATFVITAPIADEI